MKFLILLAITAIAATPEDAGKKIYTGKCARCHRLYDPAKYDDQAWDAWMQKMKLKAKLNDNQSRQLSEYIATLRRQK
jgi:hypothetical protein